jgi:hypothetical protein
MRFPAFVLVVATLLFGIVYTAPHEQAYAQSTSASPGMGPAIGALVTANAVANGFNSADPRIAATIAAIGAAAAQYGATVAAAAGEALSAVPWVAVGVSAGLGALLAGVPTSLGNDSLQQWQFNNNGTVTVSQSSANGGSPPSFPAISTGGTVWCFDGTPYSPNQDTGCGGTVSAAGQAEAQARTSSTTNVTVNSCDSGGCSFEFYLNGVDNGPGSLTANSFSNYTGSGCSTGLMVGTSGCTAYVNTTPGASSSAPVTESLAAAVAGVDPTDMSDELNPQILAATTDALWQAAAEQDGYAGLPFPVNAPPTSSQAGTVEDQLGSSAPTVGSAVSGAGSLSGASSTTPFATSVPAASNPASSVPVATNPGSGAEVNLGPDPGIGSPALETTPTAAQILAPVLGLLPDLRSWVVPSHTSECPEPTFDLWGATYTFTEQCDLLNQYQSEIYGACVAAFTVAALLIVLTA